MALAAALIATSLVWDALPTGASPARRADVTTTPGRYDAAAWAARQDDYLAWATSRPLDPGRVTSLLAYAERARRDPSFTSGVGTAAPADFAADFAKLDAFQDTGDFTINDFLYLLEGYQADLSPDLVSALQQHVLSFKYWWTEPTPPGIVDSQYYWTENHQIIFLADEYIAGQAFPTSTFTNSGMTGVDHMAHARPLILKWLATRARFGFSEWLSNIYFQEDIKGLLLLADRADDPEIATWSSDILDMLLIELASNTHAGSFSSTHGRSYEAARMTGLRESTFSTAKLVFDDTSYPYQSDNVALLATAQRYRPPAVAQAIARDHSVGVIRQHQGLPIDPTAPVSADPVPPFGLAYDDPMVWWGMGAQFPWQVVPLSVQMLDTYHLWETSNFQQAIALKPIVESSTIPDLQNLAQALARQVNPGLLSAVDTYTWRSPEASLSTAQDWRPGQRDEQALATEASLDPQAQVFVTNPANLAGAYWTGDGAAPRAAQQENVGVSIYAPQYDNATSGPLASFGYLPETHAYFPTERFDQVVERNGWVIGRKGDGYVALWSWRPTAWKEVTADDTADTGLTQRYDLQALGGADDVWITEVGRASDWASADPFSAFVDAITSAPVAVDPIGGLAHTPADGFDVQYTSPTQGRIGYGWTAPFTVRGVTVDQHDYPRWSTPWAQVDPGSVRYCVAAGGASLDLDFTDLVAGTTFATPRTPCGRVAPRRSSRRRRPRPPPARRPAGPPDPCRGRTRPWVPARDRWGRTPARSPQPRSRHR